MDPRVVALAEILRLNTKLFRNCLNSFSEEAARRRPSAETNSAAFVAAHVADSRFFLLGALGAPQANPLTPYLQGAKGIGDLKESPPLGEVLAAWAAAAHALRDRIEVLTAADWDGPTTLRFPMAETLLGALTFLVQHDSYHVGQLALLRKFAGLPAMKYT